MSFHLGKPILVMIALAVICAAAILVRPMKKDRDDLVLWVFADSHHRTYTQRPRAVLAQSAAAGSTSLAVKSSAGFLEGDIISIHEPHAKDVTLTHAIAQIAAKQITIDKPLDRALPAESSIIGPPSLIEQFEKQTGMTADVQLVAARAEGVRLMSIFMSGMHGPEVPDLAEVEISHAGKFFRPPVEDMGFLPLNDYLQKSGWMDRIVKSRYAPWSKHGMIFGVPHDVHPVALTYRHDLFMDAGIDLLAESSNPNRPLTWARFQELALQFKKYWWTRGQANRHPIELRTGGVDDLLVFLLQRRLNLIDQNEVIEFTKPKFVQTVAFYAQMVAGARRISSESGTTEAAQSQDLNSGSLCAFLTPDWKVRYIKEWSGEDPKTGKKILEGKLRMIPLPVMEVGDARTATWGGTMIAIPKACPRPDDAWKLIEHIYLSDAGFEARVRETSILPPVISQWEHPVFQRPDSFYGGQHIDRIFIDLADEIPERYVTPATAVASTTLLSVLNKAIGHVKDKGTVGLEEACAKWLKEAADDLQRRIDWGTFE